MPFTIDGQWVPNKPESNSPQPKKSHKPVKVRLVKRGQNLLTVILNLNWTPKELNTLASNLKKKLGCGGAVKGNEIEIQGDKVAETRQHLEEIGIKSL